MRRTLLHLSVALLAFGIGLFVVFEFFWKSGEQLVVVQPMEKPKINKTEPSSNVVAPDNELFKQRQGFKCQDKILSTVWNHLRKDKDFKQMADESIEKDSISDCSEIFEVSKFVDLNHDGVNEVIINGKNMLVNGAQNEAVWIVRKDKQTYKVILEESGIKYEIKKRMTNGFQDILIESHSSCCSSYKSIYKFRKESYVEDSCLLVEYQEKEEKVISTCAEEFERIQKKSK